MNISEVAKNIIGDKCNCQPDEGDCHWCIQRNGIEDALSKLESEKDAEIKEYGECWKADGERLAKEIYIRDEKIEELTDQLANYRRDL
jgi:hypothetical protein